MVGAAMAVPHPDRAIHIPYNSINSYQYIYIYIYVCVRMNHEIIAHALQLALQGHRSIEMSQRCRDGVEMA